jgi:copper chaperone CopZ
MKTMLFILAICLGQVVFSQQAKKQTIVIQTSAQCDDCKERIEGALNYTKGVKFADLDLETKKVSVQYKTKKIDAQEIKNIIAKIGYDADEVKADAESVSKLPKCCQPKGHP